MAEGLIDVFSPSLKSLAVALRDAIEARPADEQESLRDAARAGEWSCVVAISEEGSCATLVVAGRPLDTVGVRMAWPGGPHARN